MADCLTGVVAQSVVTLNRSVFPNESDEKEGFESRLLSVIDVMI